MDSTSTSWPGVEGAVQVRARGASDPPPRRPFATRDTKIARGRPPLTPVPLVLPRRPSATPRVISSSRATDKPSSDPPEGSRPQVRGGGETRARGHPRTPGSPGAGSRRDGRFARGPRACNAGYDAEREEKAAVEAARDEASKQLEFLEAELEGVRAEESALRADVKVKTEELSDLTSARDELDDEVRRLKELSNAREIECTKLRSQLSELREQHSVALDDARRYQAESERQGERAGKLAAQTSAAMSEADKLRKWQDWAKSSEVTSLQSELEVVKQNGTCCSGICNPGWRRCDG